MYVFTDSIFEWDWSFTLICWNKNFINCVNFDLNFFWFETSIDINVNITQKGQTWNGLQDISTPNQSYTSQAMYQSMTEAVFLTLGRSRSSCFKKLGLRPKREKPKVWCFVNFTLGTSSAAIKWSGVHQIQSPRLL